MKNTKQTTEVRLSSHINPISYDLLIEPDFAKFNFKGRVTIKLDFSKPDSKIVLHSKELTIKAVSLSQTGQVQTSENISYNSKAETVSLQFAKLLNKGLAELSLEFEGILNDQMRGFYRSSYELLGKKQYIATTQFESTDARRAFPCFDEPARKAIFNVSLIIPQEMKAISNTVPVETTKYEKNSQLIKFAPTPKMSTYLLAFIVGKFESIQATSSSGVMVRVFVTPGKTKQAQFALDTAVQMLEFYNKYFGIKYPLPVLDLIAIPDFAAGAMENWGAVTYRETALLIDPTQSSASAKQWVALVIAHELAHQWFGNLVTMEWWTHLWLNEGFASYIEYLAVDYVFPDWNIWTQFVDSDLGQALKLDGLANTHPVEIDVNHPDEISEIFDAVSYSKGASIIRMLASYLGERKFRDGLRYYLKKHSYGNATTSDLWGAFEYVAKKPVKKIMTNWTKQPGYPVISAKLQENKLVINQSRFYANPLSAKEQPGKRIVWAIPLSLWQSGQKPKQLLLDKKQEVLPQPKQGFKLNFGENGVFRTAYDPAILKTLEPHILAKELDAADRLGVIRDCFALNESGHFPTSETLLLLQSYVAETNYNVWSEILSGLAWLDNLLAGDKAQENLHILARNYLANIIRQVGWIKRNNESQGATLMRTLVLLAGVKYGHLETLREAKTQFKQASSPEDIDPDVRAAVYSAASRYGTKNDYQKLKKWYQAASMNEEKNRLARALTINQDKQLFLDALNFALSKQVRKQDSPLLLIAAWANNRYKNEIWQFIQDNWTELVERFGQGRYLLRKIIEPLGYLHGKGKDKQVSSFYRKNPAPGGQRAVQQAIEQIQTNNQWQSRELAETRKFLQKYVNKL